MNRHSLFILFSLLSSMGVSSCCLQNTPQYDASVHGRPESDWYAAENDMSHFYPVPLHPQVRHHEVNHLLQSPDALERKHGRKLQHLIQGVDAAAALLSHLSPAEKEALALAYLHEYEVSLAQHQISTAAQICDKEEYLRSGSCISNWDGMLNRAVSRLTLEQQSFLHTDGGVAFMEGYGGYMLLRYVAYNPQVNAETRRKALRIASFWVDCSDGALSYRATWLWKRK